MSRPCLPFLAARALADGIKLGLQLCGWGEPKWPDLGLPETSAAGVAAPTRPAAERPASSTPWAGDAGQLHIDPGHLIDAASVLIRHDYPAVISPGGKQEIRALARRLCEYAAAITAFDLTQ